MDGVATTKSRTVRDLGAFRQEDASQLTMRVREMGSS
jgi:hypothetical protein